MKQFFLLLTIILSIQIVAQETYTVSGGIGTPYVYNENLTGTGIENIYLLNTLSNASISYNSSAVSVNFYRYNTSLANKELIPDSDISTSSSGNVTSYKVNNLQDSYGYLVEENGGTKAAIWIIDYSIHQPVLSSIEAIESEDKCELLKLVISKTDELTFYAVNGNRRNIPRRYTISYNNMKWNQQNNRFEQEIVSMNEREIGTEIVIDAPLIDTQFKVRGDQFAEHFNMAKEITSATYKAIAVEAHIAAEQEARNANNEGKDESNLGGSAPVIINFYGHANEPTAYYYTWFIYNNKDLNNPIARYTDRDIRYTFNQSGDYTVMLEAAERSSVCIDTVSVSFNVSESYLEVPNFFSPDSSPGSNDEFRVAYKSLVKFKCTIFNRWGSKIYEFSDPSQGWDGKYNGRYVTTGVYFYVITAEGSDGKKYKEKGDINILRSK